MCQIDYIDRLILVLQVGAVDIDSGWSTGFNNFIFDTNKYPNATAMVSIYTLIKKMCIIRLTY